jgi:hypothetical protein
MTLQKVIVFRKDLIDDTTGDVIQGGGVDDMLLHHWGVSPVSMRDSDGTWRFHQMTVAYCSDQAGKIHMVDPESITIVKE